MQKTLKKALALLLSLLLVVLSIMPTSAVDTPESGVHLHGETEYVKWTDAAKLPTAAGHYYLDTDVDLAAAYQPTKNITICLNGHKITSTSASVTRLMMINTANITVTLEDCRYDGTFDHAGSITGGKGSGWGGAICLFKDTATLNLSGILLTGNADNGTANLGGGALLLRSGTVNLTNVKVSDNSTTALNGGAIYVNDGTLNIKNSVFENNSSGAKSGGALYLNSGSTVIENSSFTGNQGTNGAAIRCTSGASLHLKDSTVIGNTDLATGNYCGAVYILATDAAKTVIEGESVITGNQNASGTAADLMMQSAETVFTLKNPTENTKLKLRSFGTNKAEGATLAVLDGSFAGTYLWTPDSDLLIKAADGKLLLERRVLAEEIRLDRTAVTLTEGLSTTLTATVLPENTTLKDLVWTSSNETVATVDQSGNVAALVPGEAVVTATAADGSGVSATCTVTVLAAHLHDGVKYTRWEDATALPTAAGHYYLDTDVDLAAAYQPTKNITICLNGHKITSTSASVTRLMMINTANITVTLEDCRYDGTFDHAGSITGGKGSGWGGAICLFKDTATLNLSGILLTGNADNGTANLGGGALLLRSGTVNLTNVKVSDNSTTALNGGAIYVNDGTLNIKNSVFENNSSGAKSGGALYLNSGSTVIENSSFTGNQGTNGAAIRCTSGASLHLKDSTVIGNTDLATGNYCGAVYILATDAAKTVIEGESVITGNQNASGTAADLMLQNSATVFTLKNPTENTKLNLRSFNSNKTSEGGKNLLGVVDGELAGSYVWTGAELLLIRLNASHELYLASPVVTLTPELQLRQLGDTAQLELTHDLGAQATVIWTSADPTIASVDSEGLVTAVSEGVTVVTVRVNGIAAACRVSVGFHMHGEQEYQIWGATDSLPTVSGHYCLVRDVQLDTRALINSANADIHLCMNGHSITGGGQNILMNLAGGASVEIENCLASYDENGFLRVDGANVSKISGGFAEKDFAGAITVRGATLRLSGVWLTQNSTKQSGGYGGGAINVRADGVVILTGCLLSENSTEAEGGAIAIRDNAKLTLENTVLRQNTAGTKGGAIYVSSAAKTAELLLRGCVLSGNTAAADGGAICVTGGVTLTAERSELSENSVSGAGGAIYAEGTTASLTDLTFLKNDAMDGGAISVRGSSITLDSTEIRENKAAASGGGIHLSGGSRLLLQSGTVAGNTAENGGGLLTAGGASIELAGGKISGNAAENGGGGVYVSLNSSMKMTGGNISENTAAKGGGVYVNTAQADFLGGTVEANTAGTSGGGVQQKDSVLLFDGTTVTGNRCDASCGGVFSNGGEILLQSGSFTNNTTSGTGGAFVLTNSARLTMTGGEISGNTASSGAGVIIFSHGEFAMQGGSIVKNTAKKFAGGVYAAAEGGSFRMEGGSISGNTAGEGAGGLFVNNTASAEMRGGSISGNTTKGSGAGIATAGESKLLLLGGEVSGNRAQGNGGGIYINKGGALTLSGVTVSGNSTEKTGGGVFVYGNAFTMERGTRVTGNTAAVAGGGIGTGSGALFRMNGGTISYNKAPDGGGAVIQNRTGIVLNGGEICYNTVTDQGAGLYVGANVTFEMNDCQIYENTATFRGAGLFINSSGTINGGAIHDNHILGGEGLNMPSGAGILLCGELPKTLTMNGGEIYNNDSSDHGAGVRVNKGTTFVLNGGKITGNVSGGCSGGVEVFGTFISTGGEITNNKAGLNGGAIRVGDHGRLELSGTLISGNEAAKSGGAIRLNRGSKGSLTSCTITDNKAVSTGGAIYAIDDLTLDGCVIKNNTSDEGGAVFLDNSEYDGHSYFVGMFKLLGDTVIRDNKGTHPGLYLSANTAVAIPAPGLGQKAEIDVYLESGKLTDLMIGRYDYSGGDGKYLVTYGDKSYTDPEGTPPASESAQEPIEPSGESVPQTPEQTAEASWLLWAAGAVVLAGILAAVIVLTKKKSREGKGV